MSRVRVRVLKLDMRNVILCGLFALAGTGHALAAPCARQATEVLTLHTSTLCLVIEEPTPARTELLHTWVQRSAIILREKNTPFEFRHIEPDNRPDWFLAISPHKKVPVIRIDDKDSLFESNAINEYLDEMVSPQLHPKDPIQKAINRAWTDYVPTFASSVTGCAYAANQADYEKALAKIPEAFDRLEKEADGRPFAEVGAKPDSDQMICSDGESRTLFQIAAPGPPDPPAGS